MKRKLRKTAALLLAGSLVFGPNILIEGADITDCSDEAMTDETEPYVFTTGSVTDLEKKKTYDISVTEQEKEDVWIPIVLDHAGKIFCSTQCTSKVATAGSITAAICTDRDGSVVKGTEKKVELKSGKNSEYETSFYASKGKKYYLHLSISKEAMTENGVFLFRLNLQQISSANRTIKNKQVVKAYQNGKGSAIYYKVVVKKTGYLTVDTLYDEEDYGNPEIVLCNAKKKTLSVKTGNDFKGIFAVKNGTYYIKVMDVDGSYQISSAFTAVSDKSGSKKTNARQLTVGGKKIKGAVVVSDSKNKYDWYKFTLKKASYVRIDFSGSTTGNSKVKLEVIPPSSNIKFKKKAILQFSGLEGDGSGQAGTAWPAGTWYIRINKSATKGSGVYALKVKTFH